MKYLVLGEGWLGTRIYNYLREFDSVYISRDVCDIYRKPDVVINCIGKTGRPNIDWCEDHKAETLHSNTTVPLLLLSNCKELGIKMVHISTGCIYDGGIWNENDQPNYVESYYSKTKYIAEQVLSDFDVLQLRLRMPIDSIPHNRNLMTKLLSYDEIINENNSITVIEDFIKAMKALMDQDATGIYNIVNLGVITPCEIMNIYNRYSPDKKKFTKISAKELKTKAPRSNCILSNEKLNNRGIHMRPVHTAVEDTIKEYVNAEFEAVL